MKLLSQIRRFVGPFGNIHRQGSLPDIFIFSAPRTGSTFLMEVLAVQPGMKSIDEPFSMNYPQTRRELGVNNWVDATTMANRREIYARYLDRLCKGQISDFNSPFWSKNGRFYTTRNTLKILHAGEDMLPWFEQHFNCQILVLVRHPIPTVLSHDKHPRVDYFLRQPEMRAQFSERHLRFAERILASDNQYDRGVLDWCFQYYPAFTQGIKPSWTVISYEDLSVESEGAVKFLETRLQLSPTKNLAKLIAKPSGSTVQSDPTTVAFFNSGQAQGNRSYLIEKWRDRLKPHMEERTFEILDAMGLDIYSAGNLFPAEKYRIPEYLRSKS
ncbi:MAG: sulfotransferase [Alphaproteobacteria bacterium]